MTPPTCLAAALVFFAAVAAASEPGRPVMRELPPAAVVDGPPSRRDLVDARAELQRRFREPLARATTAGGASRAADALIAAALVEEDRTLKWALLAEARRLAAAAGNAPAVDRALNLASAAYEFDVIGEELAALGEIPLRGLDPPRAAALAQVAEQLATRAEGDRRFEESLRAQLLAIRAWQRAGNKPAAANAAARHDALAAAALKR